MMQIAVIVFDENGTITQWNTYAEDLFDWRADEAIGQNVTSLIMQHNDLGITAIRRQIAQTNAWQGDRLYAARDGRLVEVRVSMSRLEGGYEQPQIVLTATDISQRNQFTERLRQAQLIDPLTEIPNRTLVFDRLQQALERAQQDGSRVAVLHIDIDRFTLINDSIGHVAGDTILKGIAARVQMVLPISCTLGRLGSDEFVVLIPGLAATDQQSAKTIAQTLQDALIPPFSLESEQVVVSASIGIAFSTPDDVTPDTLLRAANDAITHVKRTNRGTVMTYDPAMFGHTPHALQLRHDLRQALAQQEFVLHFQPIVDLRTKTSVLAEALIRWQHPAFGMIPPGDFLQHAEDLGLLVPIGHWVVDEASRALIGLEQTVASSHQPMGIAINLSARQFQNPLLVDEMKRTISSSGIPAQRITLELTEEVLIQDMNAAVSTLARLRELGIRVMIDDFGSGYSSLGYLRELPVDGVKLDRSFMRGLGTKAGSLTIVEAIIQMAHTLGLHVTAEGIETPEQLELVQEMGCDYGQGFLFRRPTPLIAECAMTVA